MSSDLAKRLNAHSSTVPKGQLRDDLRTAADELERLSTPTDVADRREAIARSVYEEIRSWGDPVEIWDDLHPNDRAFIASLIAGPGDDRLLRILKGWVDRYRFATADDDAEYLNGKGWDDAEALADMTLTVLRPTGES